MPYYWHPNCILHIQCQPTVMHKDPSLITYGYDPGWCTGMHYNGAQELSTGRKVIHRIIHKVIHRVPQAHSCTTLDHCTTLVQPMLVLLTWGWVPKWNPGCQNLDAWVALGNSKVSIVWRWTPGEGLWGLRLALVPLNYIKKQMKKWVNIPKSIYEYSNIIKSLPLGK